MGESDCEDYLLIVGKITIPGQDRKRPYTKEECDEWWNSHLGKWAKSPSWQEICLNPKNLIDLTTTNGKFPV